MQLIPNIVSKTRSVLYNTHWMTLPWSKIPKTPLDKLVDIVAKMTGLLEDLEHLVDSHTGSTVHLYLRNGCHELLAELESWFNDTAPKLDIDRLLNIGKRKSSTTDLAKAHTLALFWSICLLLRPTILAILPDMQSSPRFDLHGLRYNILRLLPIFFKPDAGWYGVNIALFPARSIYDTLDEYPLSPQEARLMASLNAEYKRKEISGFLHSMAHYRSNFAQKRTADRPI